MHRTLVLISVARPSPPRTAAHAVARGRLRHLSRPQHDVDIHNDGCDNDDDRHDSNKNSNRHFDYNKKITTTAAVTTPITTAHAMTLLQGRIGWPLAPVRRRDLRVLPSMCKCTCQGVRSCMRACVRASRHAAFDMAWVHALLGAGHHLLVHIS